VPFPRQQSPHVAEALPFPSAVFNYALLVTTICFVDDILATLREAKRVLKPGGKLVMGFIDRESALGQDYVAHREENVFYRSATFYSAAEVGTLLEETGFCRFVWVQTLSTPLSELNAIEPIRSGSGRGSFVAVRAQSDLEAGRDS